MKHLCSTATISGQTITLTGVNTSLAGILLIANNTKGTILYSTGGTSGVSYTQGVPNSSITLPSSVVMSSGDSLSVYWDDLAAFPSIGSIISTVNVSPTNLGQNSSDSSSPVVIASDQSAVPVTPQISSTAALTKITTTGNHSQAADSSRYSLIFFNGGANPSYVLLGSGTASATNFSLTLNTGDTIAVNSFTGAYAVYTGSAGTPAFYITKLSA